MIGMAENVSIITSLLSVSISLLFFWLIVFLVSDREGVCIWPLLWTVDVGPDACSFVPVACICTMPLPAPETSLVPVAVSAGGAGCKEDEAESAAAAAAATAAGGGGFVFVLLAKLGFSDVDFNLASNWLTGALFLFSY